MDQDQPAKPSDGREDGPAEGRAGGQAVLAEKDYSYMVTLDDDAIIHSTLEEFVGIKNISFTTVSDAIQILPQLQPVALFVDVHLADRQLGIDIIPEAVKRWPLAPIIMISSDTSDALIGKALSMGAHDFIIKPLGPAEVTARLNARREELKFRVQSSVRIFRDMTLDLDSSVLTGELGRIEVGGKEQAILKYLIQNNSVIVSKDQLVQKVWGGMATSQNALNRKIHEARKAVKAVSQQVEIKSIYGKGVALRSVATKVESLLLGDAAHEFDRQLNP